MIIGLNLARIAALEVELSFRHVDGLSLWRVEIGALPAIFRRSASSSSLPSCAQLIGCVLNHRVGTKALWSEHLLSSNTMRAAGSGTACARHDSQSDFGQSKAGTRCTIDEITATERDFQPHHTGTSHAFIIGIGALHVRTT